MTVNISKPSINIREKLSELDFAKVPFQKMPSGSVLQVVQGTSTTELTVASTTYTDTNLTASITPSSSSNKVLIIVQQGMDLSAQDTSIYGGIRLLRGSTVIFDPNTENATGPSTVGVKATGATAVTLRTINTFSYIDTPSTTSSVSYKTQGRPYTTANSGQVRFQIDGATNDQSSIMTLMEIAG
jgi:hypothetical protein